MRVAARPLTALAAVWCLGAALDRFLVPPLAFWPCLAAVALAAWAASGWSGGARRRVACGAVAVLAAATAGGWHRLSWSIYPPDEVGLWAPAEPAAMVVDALLCSHLRVEEPPPLAPGAAASPSAPERGARGRKEEVYTRGLVWLQAVRDGAAWRPASGWARLTIRGRVEGLRAGDALRLYAEVSRPPGAENPGQRNLADLARGERRLVDCVCAAGGARLLRSGAGSSWLRGLEDLREAARVQLLSRLPPARRGLAVALLLGGYEGVGDDQREWFFRSGAMHVLSISGMHVAILSSVLFLLVVHRCAPRGLGLGGIALLAGGYCLVVGFDAPVARATLLVLAVCGGWWMQRRVRPWNVLGGAAVAVQILNPSDLFRIGPQLSFIGVAALIQFAPYCQPRDRGSADPWRRLLEGADAWPIRCLRWLRIWAWAAILLSVGVSVVALPLTASVFHVVSPGILLLNLFMVIPVALALLAGFLVMLVGSIPLLGTLVGGPLAFFCDFGLRCLEGLVWLSSILPGAYFWTCGPPLWWTSGFYVLWGAWLLAGPARIPLRRGAAFGTAWVGVGVAAAWLAPPEKDLRVTFLSVGHGLAVVVEPPGEAPWMYDCGMLSGGDRAGRIAADFLWSRGHARLQALFISHADQDHFNGVPALLERFPTPRLYCPPGMLEGDEPAVVDLRKTLAARGLQPNTLSAGDRLRSPCGLTIHILHPPPSDRHGHDNASSLVLEATYLGRRMLLTGDLEGEGLLRLLSPSDASSAPAEGPVETLLAPHHGSVRSEPARMAERFRPRIVVASDGRSGAPPALVDAYRRCGGTVYATGRDGAVTLRWNADGVAVSTYLPAAARRSPLFP